MSPPQIELVEGVRKHVFGEGLDVVEQQWLVAQLNDFLEGVKGRKVEISPAEDRADPEVHTCPFLLFYVLIFPSSNPCCKQEAVSWGGVTERAVVIGAAERTRQPRIHCILGTLCGGWYRVGPTASGTHRGRNCAWRQLA